MAKRDKRWVIEAFGSNGRIVKRLYLRAKNEADAFASMRKHRDFMDFMAVCECGFPYQARAI